MVAPAEYGPGAENEAEFGTGLAHADRLDIHEQVIPGRCAH